MFELYSGKTIVVKDGDKVTITDPCYDRDSKGGLNVKLPAGEYACFYDEQDEGCWGKRIARAAIVRKDKSAYIDVLDTKWKGTVGVDAGLCGFFVNKPDYDDDAWDKFCDDLEEIDKGGCKNIYHTDEGFFTSSGYGDGTYTVRILMDREEKVGLMVTFIEEDDY